MPHALRLAAALAALVLSCAAAAQQPYPSRPIRMVIPLAAASAVDNAARIVAEKMSANMGQSIVIENLPGAAGQIGADVVAKAKPDGYTLGGFNDSIMTMLPNMGQKLPWDILRDFEPVSLVATVEWGLVVNKDAPYKSAADLIADARAHPGDINYGSGGNGSPQHIAMALFANQAGIRMTHVPYKGASQAALGVAAGEVPVAFQGLATVTGLVRGGKLHLLGDRGDLGAAGLRVQFVVHHRGARRDSEADHRPAERRDREGARRSRRAREAARPGPHRARLEPRGARDRDAKAAREVREAHEGSRHPQRVTARKPALRAATARRRLAPGSMQTLQRRKP
jgi:tripartite-type tricarboxylate transporter receptor subunit TctC